MVANLTVGKKGYEEAWDEMKQVAAEVQVLKAHFLRLVDRDTEAFNAVMDGFRMPKSTEEQKAARDKAIMEATKQATLVPFEVLEAVPKALELALIAAKKGNKNSTSDAGVAGAALRCAAEGAWLNVRTNLVGIDDEDFKSRLLSEGREVLQRVCQGADAVGCVVDEALGC
jgi:glutamate formiminotransferase/formiminotetrahydrofolate cyclodeaminase